MWSAQNVDDWNKSNFVWNLTWFLFCILLCTCYSDIKFQTSTLWDDSNTDAYLFVLSPRPALEVADDDGCTTLARVESPHPSDEEEAGILKTMCRTTRYGRKPRPIQTYEAPTLATRKRRPSAPPADTLPVASTSHFSSPPHASIPTRSVIMSPGRDMFARSPSGQLISLTNLGHSSPAAEMAGSQFVFVASPPKPNADGTISTSPQVIHVYLVSNTSAAPPGGLQQVLPSIEAPPSETTSVPDITTAHISDAAEALPCESNCERSPSSQDRLVTEVVRT